MHLDFLAWLTLIMVVLWIPIICRCCFCWPKKGFMAWWARQGKEYGGVLLLVVLIRCCLVEAFRIPSGSMEPSLMTGDLIVVNRFVYGIHSPFGNTTLVRIGAPKRGDIMVFRSPIKVGMDLVKRVIGIPGDQIDIDGKQLRINGKKVKLDHPHSGKFVDDLSRSWPTMIWQEHLPGQTHLINEIDSFSSPPGFHAKIPAGQYFVMGDNRDASDDSRYWGLVPEDHLLGKVVLVLGSWDFSKHRLRKSRFGLLPDGDQPAQ